MVLNLAGSASSSDNGKNTRKAWKMIILDAAIIGAIAMGASMPSTIPTIESGWIMFKAFFIAFVFQVAVERGLKRDESE